MLHVAAARSLLDIGGACAQAGIELQYLVVAGESAITRGRSNMAATFLRSKCDTLAFLDADIEIAGADFVKLVLWDKPIRGAAVNLKTLDHTESLSVFEDGQRLTRESMPTHPIEVAYLGGSVMLIERDVIDTLSRLYAYLRYADPIAGEGVHLFEEIVTGGALLSEDYAFCYRARDKGFTVWCDPSVIVSHYEGRMAWRF
jgi:hypothetical protein